MSPRRSISSRLLSKIIVVVVVVVIVVVVVVVVVFNLGPFFKLKQHLAQV